MVAPLVMIDGTPYTASFSTPTSITCLVPESVEGEGRVVLTDNTGQAFEVHHFKLQSSNPQARSLAAKPPSQSLPSFSALPAIPKLECNALPSIDRESIFEKKPKTNANDPLQNSSHFQNPLNAIVNPFAEYIDNKFFNGASLLHCACGRGLPSLVSHLLGMGMQVNALDNMRRTPLHYACSSGDVDTVVLLLQHNASLTPDVYGKNPLQMVPAPKKASLIPKLAQWFTTKILSESMPATPTPTTNNTPSLASNNKTFTIPHKKRNCMSPHDDLPQYERKYSAPMVYIRA